MSVDSGLMVVGFITLMYIFLGQTSTITNKRIRTKNCVNVKFDDGDRMSRTSAKMEVFLQCRKTRRKTTKISENIFKIKQKYTLNRSNSIYCDVSVQCSVCSSTSRMNGVNCCSRITRSVPCNNTPVDLEYSRFPPLHTPSHLFSSQIGPYHGFFGGCKGCVQ